MVLDHQEPRGDWLSVFPEFRHKFLAIDGKCYGNKNKRIWEGSISFIQDWTGLRGFCYFLGCIGLSFHFWFPGQMRGNSILGCWLLMQECVWWGRGLLFCEKDSLALGPGPSPPLCSVFLSSLFGNHFSSLWSEAEMAHPPAIQSHSWVVGLQGDSTPDLGTSDWPQDKLCSVSEYKDFLFSISFC